MGITMLKRSTAFAIIAVMVLPSVFNLPEDVDNSELDDGFDFEVELADEVIRLIETCFTNVNRLVTLSGTVSRKLAMKVHESESMVVTRMSTEVPSLDEAYVIAKQSMQKYHFDNYFRFDHGAQGFVLSATSQPILHQQITDLKKSRWWNAGGLFIILDAGTAFRGGCDNAESFLWLAWQYGMLSSVFLCHDVSGKLSMYTYSPYNDVAPKSWLKAGQRLGRNSHPWILLKRHVSEGPVTCSEAFYDKTKFLNGYKIRTNAVSLLPRFWVDDDKTGFDKYTGEEAELMRSIFHFLNASFDEVTYRGEDHVGYVDDNGTYAGMLGDVFTGRVDLGLNARFMVVLWQVEMSQFYATTDICLVVKSRGNVPQWLNLASVFDVWVSLGLVIAISISTVVFSYHGGAYAGCLNGIRLVIATAVLRPPSQVSARLFVGSVFLVLMIFNGLFQGRLVSLLTRPRAYRNPDTQSDLVDAGYAAMGSEAFRQWIVDPVLRSRYRSVVTLEYVERSFDDEKIAKILDCNVLFKSKSYGQLHVLRQKLQTYYLVFVARSDWPLLERFNVIIRKLFEAGFPGFWRTRDALALTPRGAKSLGQNDSVILSMKGLAFMFNWLWCGLAVATLVFFFEVFSVRYKTVFRRRDPRVPVEVLERSKLVSIGISKMGCFVYYPSSENEFPKK